MTTPKEWINETHPNAEISIEVQMFSGKIELYVFV